MRNLREVDRDRISKRYPRHKRNCRYRRNPYVLALFNPRKRSAEEQKYRKKIRIKRTGIRNCEICGEKLSQYDPLISFPTMCAECAKERHVRATGRKNPLFRRRRIKREDRKGIPNGRVIDRLMMGVQRSVEPRENPTRKFEDECFLDPRNRKHFVCDKKTGRYSCDALRREYIATRGTDLAEKAHYIAKRLGCNWAIAKQNPNMKERTGEEIREEPDTLTRAEELSLKRQ